MVNNVDQFTKKLKDLLGEAESSDYNIPVTEIKSLLEHEAYLLGMQPKARFMHELR